MMTMVMLISSLLSAHAQDLLAIDPSAAGSDIDQHQTLNVQLPTASAIINGDLATEDDYPMAGGLLMSGSVFGYAFDTFVCSSTLIAPDVVLLAAHCLDEYVFTFGLAEIDDKELWWTRQADLTSWDGQSRNPDLPSDAIEVVGYTIHEGFDIQRMQLGTAENNDIALMFLAEALTDAPIAYLPTADEATQIDQDDIVTVVGWGQQIATGQQEMPPAGSFAIKIQGESHIAELDEFEFQVGLLEDDVRKCHGDSGGPSFLDVETDSTESMRLIGVTSHAYDQSDCNETGGVDTRVDAFLEWIDSEMVVACEDGTRVWCDDVTGILPPPQPAVSDKDELEGGKEEGRAGCSALAASSGFLVAGLSLLAVASRRRQDG
jgi:hypothetical protein